MNYIEILNNSDSNVNFELIYTLDKQVVVEKTPDFSSKKIRRLDLPYNAIVIILRVWILLANGKYKQIYDESISKSERRCYGISGSGESAICKRIDCSIIPDRDFIDIINKTETKIRFDIIYTIEGKGYKETSSDIKPSRGGSIIVPRTAENVQLKVFMLEEKPHQDVWHPIYVEYIKHPFKFCYQVSGNISDAVCKKVPCNTIGGEITLCPPCCCCCCSCKYIRKPSK